MRPKRRRLKKGVRTIIRKNSYVIKRLGLPPLRPLEVTYILGNLYIKAPDGELVLLKESSLPVPAYYHIPYSKHIVDESKDPIEQLVERINGYRKDWLEGIKDPIGPIKSYDGIVKEE